MKETKILNLENQKMISSKDLLFSGPAIFSPNEKLFWVKKDGNDYYSGVYQVNAETGDNTKIKNSFDMKSSTDRKVILVVTRESFKSRVQGQVIDTESGIILLLDLHG